MTRIYIYSPSSTILEKSAFRRGVNRLKHLGYEVELDRDVMARDTRFAGDDATRLRAIGRAAASGADLAMVSRGGYGLTRLLPQLPYDALHKAVANGTRFVGFSDFTALQAATFAKRKTVTWAGPSVGSDFGRKDEETGLPDDIMEACFTDLASDQGEGTGWRMPKDSPALQFLDANDEASFGTGTVWGGNLCVLVGLLGTPYFPKIKGGILWLEDIAEHPYRIERMLTQLLHAGVLAPQKAIVLGHFTHYTLGPADRGFKMASVVHWLQKAVDVPILTGLPFGHVPTKVVLPFGLRASLSVQGREALLYWG